MARTKKQTVPAEKPEVVAATPQTITELKTSNVTKAREEVAAVLAKYDCRYSIKVLLSTDGNEFIINIVNN